MSEMINNREYRQKVLKELIMELHNGKSPEEVKERFAKLIEGVTPSEISDMEQNLIMEGMPVEEVQRLCDVHAAVFKGSIEEIHRPQSPEEIPGHPVHTFKRENREIERLIRERVEPALEDFEGEDSKENLQRLQEALEPLWELDKHYSRKENLLFPYLEKYGITAPPKVMWGVDDEIREQWKAVGNTLAGYKGNLKTVGEEVRELTQKVLEMVFKEESILFPMALETLTEDEWLAIMEESDEIGYCLTKPQGKWVPQREEARETETIATEDETGSISFATGSLTPKEINGILNHLPLDITFIDKDDVVRYFSQGKERIFTRTKAAIGRTVQNCHPPASVHIVEKILEDFKAGKKDHEDFWISMGERYVYIRYFAVRDEEGTYIGTMEVTQDIQPIQEIQGEKRLLSQ
jgi:DUF438 domain-containing protein